MADNKPVFVPVWARRFPALPINGNKNVAKNVPIVAQKIYQAR